MSPLDQLLTARAAGWHPDAAIQVDQWAEANRVLPPGTPEAGPYRSARTPYLIDIQRTMSPSSPWREGWWCKPVQVGGSTSGENMIGCWICAAAGPVLVIFPTLDKGKQWELARFEPMRANTRELRQRIRPPDERGSDNTKLRKRFPGGWLRILGGKVAIKSDTVRYIKLEEPDDYPSDVGGADGREGQGSIVNQARSRVRNFGRRGKLFGDGTPTIEGSSLIVEQAARGDCRAWYLHCPSCGHPQTLEWDLQRLKWPDGDPAGVRLACETCGALHTEHEWKLRNYAPRPPGASELEAKAAGLAHWLPTRQGEPGIASWTGFNALGAPIGWRPWPGLVSEWLAAQSDRQALKSFYNDVLAKPYKDDERVAVGADQLRKRAENYPAMQVPQGGLVLVLSVDTQDNRLAVLLRAWGRGEESWGVWHDEIYGDPSLPEGVEGSPWGKLSELLGTRVKHEGGQLIAIDACVIDEGGHHTEDVRNYCRQQQLRGRRHVFPVAGAKQFDAPRLGKPKRVEFNWRGKEVPGGVELRHIGTQGIKHLIDARLKLKAPGGGFYHFPLAFREEFYTQLRAEQTQWHRDGKGRRQLWWVNPKGARNEAFDLEVYNYAGFLYLLSGRHAENVWRDRERIYGARQQLELLDDGAPKPAQTSEPAPADPQDGQQQPPWQPTPAPPQVTRPARQRRGGFVTRWR